MCEYCKVKTTKTGWKHRGARLADKYPDDKEKGFTLSMQPIMEHDVNNGAVKDQADGTKRIMLRAVEYDNKIKPHGHHLEVEIFYCPFCGEKFD